MKFDTRLSKGLVSIAVQVPVKEIDAATQRLAEATFEVLKLEQEFWGDSQ